jgi:hypothetical protein
MPTINSQAFNAEAVTPNDSANISIGGLTLGDDSTQNGVSLFVGGAGNVRVTMLGGQIVTYNNVSAGSFMPIQVIKVWATGTTATNILELY